MSFQPNRLGWVTKINVNASSNRVNVSSYGDTRPMYISVGQQIEADLHIVAENPGALMKQFDEWMHRGVTSPGYQEEYLCLYCGSPNRIEHTHCKKCGAPRSFVIG